ncbi:MAG: hypothetical protein ACREE9_01020 [Stellaceae bacterium]
MKQAALNAITSSVQLSYRLKIERAQNFVRFGVTRRLEMIWHAYSDLISTADPKRESPISYDESVRLMADLNLIYINIRGVLDNLSWALLHERGSDKISTNPRGVGIFLPCIVRDRRFASIHAEIQEHDAWDREVKRRRDPAAHQIPLVVASQFLNQDQAEAYRKLEDELPSAFVARDWEAADAIMERQRDMGRFLPYFTHDPEDGLIPIYPTTPEDIGHVVERFRIVDAFL